MSRGMEGWERELSLIGIDWKRTTNHHGEAGLGAELAEIYNDVAISLMAKNIYILYATWPSVWLVLSPFSVAARSPSHLLNKLGCWNLASPRTPHETEKERVRTNDGRGNTEASTPRTEKRATGTTKKERAEPQWEEDREEKTKQSQTEINEYPNTENPLSVWKWNERDSPWPLRAAVADSTIPFFVWPSHWYRLLPPRHRRVRCHRVDVVCEIRFSYKLIVASSSL